MKSLNYYLIHFTAFISLALPFFWIVENMIQPNDMSLTMVLGYFALRIAFSVADIAGAIYRNATYDP